MKRVPKIIVLTSLFVIGFVGLAYMGIMVYIHYDVLGKALRMRTRGKISSRMSHILRKQKTAFWKLPTAACRIH